MPRAIGTMNKLREIIPMHILKIRYMFYDYAHLYFGINAWGLFTEECVGIAKDDDINYYKKIKSNAHT